MLTALEAVASVATTVTPVVQEVSAVVTAITILIKILPYISDGAVAVYKETLIIAPKVDDDFLKVLRYLHTEVAE